MTEATETDYADFGSRTDIVTEQGTGRSDTGAQPCAITSVRELASNELMDLGKALTSRRHLR